MTQMQRSTPNDAGVLPSWTVIVCTRERPQQLERCLASLLTLINPRVALHVVENGTHPTCEKLASRFGHERFSLRRKASLLGEKVLDRVSKGN